LKVKATWTTRTPITRDTKAQHDGGLLGEKQLNLTPGDPNAPALRPEKPFYGSNAGFEKIAAVAGKLTARLKSHSPTSMRS
jgi:hypothetical protein